MQICGSTLTFLLQIPLKVGLRRDRDLEIFVHPNKREHVNDSRIG